MELVDALPLEPFGLDTPPPLPCLSLRYHLAQKIHAMTQPATAEDEANERFRDLADLLLMRELAPDLSELRDACVKVFAFRGTHGWPPNFQPPDFWEEPFANLVRELGLSIGTVDDAAKEARAFIAAVDAAL